MKAISTYKLFKFLKKSFDIILLLFALFSINIVHSAEAQNTYPATGMVSLIGGNKVREQLHIESSDKSWNGIYVKNTSARGQAGYGLMSNNGAYDTWLYLNYLGTYNIHHGGVERLSILNNGYVGIGTTAPATKLDVQDDQAALLSLKFNQTYGNAGILMGDNSDTQYALTYDKFPAVGGGYLNLKNIASSNGVHIGSSDIWFGSGPVQSDEILSSSDAFIFNGRIGIGTATPSTNLEIASASPYITLNKNTPFNFSGQGETGIKMGIGGNTAFSIRYTNYPAFLLSSTLNLETNDATRYGIHITQGSMWLGKGSSLGTTDQKNLSNDDQIIMGGNVGIGTAILAKGFRLTVQGKTMSEESWVQLAANWPDYVFDKDYKLKTLEEVEQYVKENRHLPEVPAAEEMNTNGLNVGVMNTTLMKKVEELTLYLIEANKEIKNNRQSIEELLTEIKILRDENEAIKMKINVK